MEEPAPLGAAISEAAEPTDIGGLGLPPRTEKMLLDAGYSTVPQLLEVLRTDESSLLQIKGFGEKSLETLKAALAEKGMMPETDAARMERQRWVSAGRVQVQGAIPSGRPLCCRRLCPVPALTRRCGRA